MQYHYFKAQPFSENEIYRIAINVKLHHILGLDYPNQPIESELLDRFFGAESVQQIVANISALIKKPHQQFNLKAYHWLMSYCTPQIIDVFKNQTIKAIQHNKKTDLFLKLTSEIDSQSLLHFDYLQPDVQWVGRAKSSCLLCFTGISLKMMMPNQLFNGLAIRHFDQIVYFNDASKQRFINGIKGFADDLMEFEERIKEMVQPFTSISIIGVSTGGIAAVHFAQKLSVNKCLLMSPSMEFKEWSVLSDKTSRLNQQNFKVFFSSQNELDTTLLNQWQVTQYKDCIHCVAGDSHNSAVNLLMAGQLMQEIAWLAER